MASRILPGLDERIYNRKRNLEMRDEISTGDYATKLADLPNSPDQSTGLRDNRPTHLVVVPQVGPSVDTWRPAGGNFFYEISQSAREYVGAEKVSVFPVEAGQDAADWHTQLIRFLITSGATHLIAQVEADPNSGQTLHSWDTFFSQLHTRWDGVLLGVVTDSSYIWITAGVRRLARMSPRFLLVDICMPMNGVLVKNRNEVGPVNMPISNESLAVVDSQSFGLQRIHDVVFMGVLYPYRVKLLDELRCLGVRVAINPHRKDSATDLTTSQNNQPKWLDYMLALSQSKMVINFSQSSAGPFQQLKTRVLEASSMGCLVLTDDIDRTSRFWVPELEYGYFSGPADVPILIERFLSNPAKLASAQERARVRAREINISSFWGGIEEGLLIRNLPSLLKR